MATTDNMSIYDDSYAPAVGALSVAMTPVAYKLVKKMQKEQKLFNETNGKKGVNWSGNAKALDDKLKKLPGNLLSKAKDIITGETKLAKDAFSRSIAGETISQEDIQAKRERIQSLDPNKNADEIADIKQSIKNDLTRNKIAEDVKLYDANEKLISDMEGQKTKAVERNRLIKQNKALNNKIKNFTKDPKIGQAIEDKISEAKLARDTGKVKLKPKTKFPKKTAGLMAAGGLANYALGDLVSRAGDYSHDVADNMRKYDSKGELDNTDVSAPLADAAGTGLDYASLAPGALSAAGLTGLAGNYGLNRLQNTYNIQNDPEGMGKIDSLKQAKSDAVEAVKDKYAQTKSKMGQAGKYLGTGGMFADENTKAQRAAEKAELDEFYSSRKKKRWTDPRAQEFANRNKKIDEESKSAEDSQSKSDNLEERVRKARNTATRAHVIGEIDNEIDFAKYAISKNEKILADAMEQPNVSKNNTRVTNAREAIKSALEDIKILEGDKMGIDDLNTDADLRKNYTHYFGEGSKEKIKHQADILKRQVAGAAQDTMDAGKQAYAAAEPKVEDAINTVKEKNKGWYKKAKEMPGNMYDRVFGKSEVPTAGASGQSTTAGAPDTKQGKIRKTAKLGGKLGTAATLPQIGEAAWGLADIGHGLYDAPDKGQFVQETGESMYEGLKNLPEELMTTAQDYKTMYDQGEYLPMVGKAAQDYLVPSVKSLGNIAMGLGEQAGLYEAPDYWDLDAKDFSTLSERDPNYTPPVDFHPSQMSPGTKQLMTPEPKIKESGITPPAAENVPELDKRAIAEKYMADRQAGMDKMQMAHNQAKYGGYQNQDDYAQSFGVKALPNTLNRYGNTPVYEGVDEFGNRSFSDSPGQVADPSKYDQVARNAADTARAQYLQFKKGAEAKAKQDAIHPALRGLSEEQRYALGPREQAKAILDNNKIQANKGKEKDLYDRNLASNLGNVSDQAHIRQGHTNNLTQRLISGQATPDEVNSAKLMVREGVLDTGVKLPFFSTPTKYQLKLNTDSNDPNYVDVAGKWFESMPKEYEDLNIATTMYDKKPKY